MRYVTLKLGAIKHRKLWYEAAKELYSVDILDLVSAVIPALLLTAVYTPEELYFIFYLLFMCYSRYCIIQNVTRVEADIKTSTTKCSVWTCVVIGICMVLTAITSSFAVGLFTTFVVTVQKVTYYDNNRT